MKELKWTFFSDKDMPHQGIYMTDFKKVWVYNSRHIYIHGPYECAWAEIPIPEVPKKEKKLHKCKNVTGHIKCYEDENGILRINAKMRDAEFMSSNFPVNFCPFCGFKPEKVES